MRILLVSYAFYPSIGGIETIGKMLAQFFVDHGHSVLVVTQSSGDKDTDREALAYPVLRKPSMLALLRSYLWADVVLHNNISMRFLWPRLLIFKPVVISLQTWLPGIKSWVKRLSLNLASRVISCSEAIKRELFNRALVIGNPYDDQLFRIIPSVHRRESIVFLGRLVDDKGAADLLEAFARLNCPGWSLSIIGGGPELPSLVDLADNLNISNSVSFIGPLHGEELVYSLNQHKVMVVPSRWREPFGIVALEGLACGCSLLVSDGGGLPDAVGKAGLVFKRCDQNSLLKNLSALIYDADLRESLTARSTRQLSEHTKNKVCQKYLDVLSAASN